MFCGGVLITAIQLLKVCGELSDATSKPTIRCTCPISALCLVGVMYTNASMFYLLRLNTEDSMGEWSDYFMGDADSYPEWFEDDPEFAFRAVFPSRDEFQLTLVDWYAAANPANTRGQRIMDKLRFHLTSGIDMQVLSTFEHFRVVKDVEPALVFLSIRLTFGLRFTIAEEVRSGRVDSVANAARIESKLYKNAHSLQHSHHNSLPYQGKKMDDALVQPYTTYLIEKCGYHSDDVHSLRVFDGRIVPQEDMPSLRDERYQHASIFPVCCLTMTKASKFYRSQILGYVQKSEYTVIVGGLHYKVPKPLGPFGFFRADINGSTAGGDRLGQSFAGIFAYLDEKSEQRKHLALVAQSEEAGAVAAKEAEAVSAAEAEVAEEQDRKAAEREEAKAVAEHEEKAAAEAVAKGAAETEAKAAAVTVAVAAAAKALAAKVAQEKVVAEDLERERLRATECQDRPGGELDGEGGDALQSAKDKAVELELEQLADLLNKLHILCKAFATPNINTNQATMQANALLFNTYTDLLKPLEGSREANPDRHVQLEVKMVYIMLGGFSTSESAYNMTSIIAACAMVDEVARIFKEKNSSSSRKLSYTATSLAGLAIEYGLVVASDPAAVTHLKERLRARKHAKRLSIVARYMGPVDAILHGDVHAMRSKYTKIFKQARGHLAEILKARTRADSSGLFEEPSSNLKWAEKTVEMFLMNTDAWTVDNYTDLQNHLDKDPLSAASAMANAAEVAAAAAAAASAVAAAATAAGALAAQNFCMFDPERDEVILGVGQGDEAQGGEERAELVVEESGELTEPDEGLERRGSKRLRLMGQMVNYSEKKHRGDWEDDSQMSQFSSFSQGSTASKESYKQQSEEEEEGDEDEEEEDEEANRAELVDVLAAGTEKGGLAGQIDEDSAKRLTKRLLNVKSWEDVLVEQLIKLLDVGGGDGIMLRRWIRSMQGRARVSAIELTEERTLACRMGVERVDPDCASKWEVWKMDLLEDEHQWSILSDTTHIYSYDLIWLYKPEDIETFKRFCMSLPKLKAFCTNRRQIFAEGSDWVEEPGVKAKMKGSGDSDCEEKYNTHKFYIYRHRNR